MSLGWLGCPFWRWFDHQEGSGFAGQSQPNFRFSQFGCSDWKEVEFEPGKLNTKEAGVHWRSSTKEPFQPHWFWSIHKELAVPPKWEQRLLIRTQSWPQIHWSYLKSKSTAVGQEQRRNEDILFSRRRTAFSSLFRVFLLKESDWSWLVLKSSRWEICLEKLSSNKPRGSLANKVHFLRLRLSFWPTSDFDTIFV